MKRKLTALLLVLLLAAACEHAQGQEHCENKCKSLFHGIVSPLTINHVPDYISRGAIAEAP